MNARETALKVLLAAFCAVNIVIGIIAFSSNQNLILWVGSNVYGVKLSSLEAHTLYAIRMMGCLLIAVGIMCGLSVKEPLRNRAVIYGVIVWLIMRVTQRILDIEPFHQAFGIPYTKLWGSIIFVSLTAIAFLLLLPKDKTNT